MVNRYRYEMDFLFAPALWKSCLRQQERQARACLSTFAL
ncbi:hypothetical protein CEV34_3813 [Brucella pseudogrignonensis]|uniref:Uncharacterized protein n=1 Tax=Brucella pseudogrignonensis TaxID=419475 RepID=A0A256G7K7_9HYPH|nr:hypothetical protein CEV34_3813 [Brucella pseudogrignonensis]